MIQYPLIAKYNTGGLEMKEQERILCALKGGGVDRVPWSPFLAYWWEHQSQDIRNMGEIELLWEFGADPLIRGHIPLKGQEAYQHLFVYDIHRKNCEVRERISGNRKTVQYETKVGTLAAQYQMSDSGNTWFLCTHPVKTAEDFNVLQYIIEHTELRHNFSAYQAIDAQYGDRALALPLVSPETKTGFQSLIEFWVGTEEMAYAMMDMPDVVEATVQAMQRLSLRGAQICAESPAPAFLTWEDSSTTNYAPSQYAAYIVPEIDAWCNLLHDSGKLYVQHACGHVKDLLPYMEASQADCIESISPPPTGSVSLVDARNALSKAIIGGIEPTHFLDLNQEELRAYVAGILETMKGTRYILANSDSCPPGVAYEKFGMISEIVKGFA